MLRFDDFDGTMILDSRDVVKLQEDLQDEYDNLQSEIENGDTTVGAAEDWNEENLEFLTKLNKFVKDAETYARDLSYSTQIIPRDLFVDYVKELIADCYELPKELESGRWPYNHFNIDYDAAADEVEQDYTSVYFGDIEYLVHSV